MKLVTLSSTCYKIEVISLLLLQGNVFIGNKNQK